MKTLELDDIFTLKGCEPDSNISFYNNHAKEIGKLIWDDDGLKFEGNANEAAEIFFNEIIMLYDKNMKELGNLRTENWNIKREIAELIEAWKECEDDDEVVPMIKTLIKMFVYDLKKLKGMAHEN